MEIALEPEIYSPSIDQYGNYVDRIGRFFGTIRCPCGARKDKSYSGAQFAKHITTKTHQQWLQSINDNRCNYFVECEKLKELAKSQRLIIAHMEKKLAAFVACEENKNSICIHNGPCHETNTPSIPIPNTPSIPVITMNGTPLKCDGPKVKLHID